MADDWDQFDDADPWAQFEDAPKAKPKKRKRSAGAYVKGLVANLNRGLGVGDELVAGARTLEGLATGRHRFGIDRPGNALMNNAMMLRDAYRNELAAERRTEDEFAGDHPIIANLARGVGMAGPSALPAGAAAQGGNAMMQIARGATVGATGGYLGGLADRGNLRERVGAANTGAAIGGALGGAISGIAAGRNVLQEIAARRADPVNAIARHAPQDPTALRARRAQMQADGFEEPTLLDLMDDAGQDVVRATASRQTPAKSRARAFAEGRVENMPYRVARQARRLISDDPRTPDQIRADLIERRSALAAEDYAPAYAQPVEINMGMARQLQGAPGRAAMQRARMAAEARNDELQMVEIDRLLDGDFFTPLRAGTLHRIQVAMGERADRAMARGARDIGGGLVERTEGLRRGLEDVPGLDEAHATYRDLSRRIEAADAGEQFLSPDADNFVANLEGLTPDQNAVARATARRAVQAKAGENISAAPGVARRIATAPEQQIRNRALLGDEGAAQLEAGMAVEGDAVRNAVHINPRVGSKTQPSQEVAARISEGVQDVSALASGNPLTIMARVANRLRTLGIDDRQAEAIVDMAISRDQDQLERAIRAIEQRGVSHQQAAEIVQHLRLAAGAGYVAGAAPDSNRGVSSGIHGDDGFVYWEDGSVTPE